MLSRRVLVCATTVATVGVAINLLSTRLLIEPTLPNLMIWSYVQQALTGGGASPHTLTSGLPLPGTLLGFVHSYISRGYKLLGDELT